MSAIELPRAPINEPFENYRWQWASLMVQENLKTPETFLSVLRVMLRYDGLTYTADPTREELLQDLEAIGISNNGRPMALRRNDGSNVLIRNDQVYWTACGCLVPTKLTEQQIRVTSLGKALSIGEITLHGFGELMVNRLQLPNPIIIKEDHR